jgi:small subunit ribosomal protein S1
MKKFMPEGWLIDTPENKAAVKNVDALMTAAERGTILEAKAVLCDYEHNLVVDLGDIRGIIPRTEGAVGIAEGQVRDIALISRVNKPVCFVVKRIETSADGSKTAFLSRREAQLKCSEEYVSQLACGDIINARVTHLETFGAFCDIGCGIIALMPIDAISVSRIAHPCDRFCCGDDLLAVVKSIDADGRVSLSHRELLGTWEENAAGFMQGETVSGIVRTVEEYGIFIELAPNLAGLAEPRAGVFPGQQASVYIKSIIPEKMKVKLIVIDSFDADYAPAPIEYYIRGSHIDYWRYSPENCSKVIETRF